MRRPHVLASLLLLTALVTSACRTATAPSLALARETLVEVIAYQKAVRDLHDIVMESERRSLEQLRGVVATQKEQVVLSARTALAFEAADQVLDHGFRPTEFRNYIVSTVDPVAEAGGSGIARLDAALADLGNRNTGGASRLANMEKFARVLRQKLEALQTRPDRKDELDQYRALLDAARAALREEDRP